MASDNASFNRDLYDLLKVRGYHPVPLDSKNQRVNAPQEADVIQFVFTKDGKEYGKVWISIDKSQQLTLYYDNEQEDSPNDVTPGVEYDDTWTGLLKNIKKWAMRRQLDFDLENKDRLGDDMRQREHYKMKEKLGEGYHAMGKARSYNDAVPNVKIVLQHNRNIEEGEQRFRNVARIFVENTDGERFLLPTNRPGIARVYARHIAEGGTPYDERGKHITSLVEEYNQMAGFVRATRNGQFNESTQSLVNEGISHYTNLRETLSKMTGLRGYDNYFESWTPALMEDDGDNTAINELFVQETLDPRIESVMPILSRLHKKVNEMNEVTELAEWADSIANEGLIENPEAAKEHDDFTVSHPDHGHKTFRAVSSDEAAAQAARSWGISTKDKNLSVKRGGAPAQKATKHSAPSASDNSDDLTSISNPLERAKAKVKKKRSKKRRFFNVELEEVDDEHTEEENDMAQDNLRKMSAASGELEKNVKKMGNTKSLEPWQQQLIATAADKVDAVYHSKDDDEIDEELEPWMGKDLDTPSYLRKKEHDLNKRDAEGGGSKLRTAKNEPEHEIDENFISMDAQAVAEDELDESSYPWLDHNDRPANKRDKSRDSEEALRKEVSRKQEKKVEEDLDANQKRVGQLGPTEKVKNNNIGKLVGANESIDAELAHIRKLSGL